MDWSSLFEFEVSALELVVRGSLLYWFLLLVFRFVMRRGAGTVGIADVLLVVLLADASQNAMAGGYTSVGEGFVLVSTLLGWNYLLDWASYRFKAVDWLTAGPPLLLVRHGRVIHRNLRSEHLTLEELKATLRENGVASFERVRAAFMEADGTISVLQYKSRDDPKPPAGNKRIVRS